MTDAEIKAALTDLQALALTLDAEGRGDRAEGNSSVEERIAVGCAIRNRVAHPRRFGVTYRAVCLAPKQFSCWFVGGGAANYLRTLGIARALVEGAPLPISQPDTALLHESIFLAEGIVGGQLLDRVNGATHYMTRALWKAAPPAWARGLRPAAVVGSQVFFAGVA